MSCAYCKSTASELSNNTFGTHSRSIGILGFHRRNASTVNLSRDHYRWRWMPINPALALTFRSSTFPVPKLFVFFWGGGGRMVALIFYRSGLNFPEIQNWIVIVGNTDSPSLNWKGLDIVQRLASFLSECNYINQQAKLVFRICCNCSADIKSKSIKLQLITLFVRNACGERAELSSKIVEEPIAAF